MFNADDYEIKEKSSDLIFFDFNEYEKPSVIRNVFLSYIQYLTLEKIVKKDKQTFIKLYSFFKKT